MDDSANTHFVCKICGVQHYVASIITLQANYGSIHDGEQMMFYVCGDCMDKLYGIITIKKAAKTDEY